MTLFLQQGNEQLCMETSNFSEQYNSRRLPPGSELYFGNERKLVSTSKNIYGLWSMAACTTLEVAL